ncbi:MAG TPA: DUF3592 domain-containing protein [Candidatus Binatia bacterium]|nr:DUF3592 domain-containing protein [Candidatus Binatia bacterium]
MVVRLWGRLAGALALVIAAVFAAIAVGIPEARGEAVLAALLAAGAAAFGVPALVWRFSAIGGDEDVLEHGTPGSATITSLERTRWSFNRRYPIVRFALNVEAAGLYPARVTQAVDPAVLGRLAPGAVVGVRVDPADRKRVVIDWREPIRAPACSVADAAASATARRGWSGWRWARWLVLLCGLIVVRLGCEAGSYETGTSYVPGNPVEGEYSPSAPDTHRIPDQRAGPLVGPIMAGVLPAASAVLFVTGRRRRSRAGPQDGECTMRTSIVVLALLSAVGSWSAQPAWGADPRRPAPGPLSAPPSALPPSVRQPSAAAIKHFGIWTPVVGSNKTLGRVQLTAPAGGATGVTITLTSSHPAVVAPPAAVTVQRGQADHSFEIPTFPVTAPTTVTITAHVGGETATAAVTVVPASLAVLGCQPFTIPVGTTTTCTVWLDGAAAAPTVVPLSSPEYGPQFAPHALIPAGERKASVPVPGLNTTPVPRTVRIHAAYAGVTKSVPITVGPSYLKAVSIARTSFNDHGLFEAVARVDLSATARSAFRFRMRLQPATAFIQDYGAFEFHIAEGRDSGEFRLVALPAAADTPVKLEVLDTYQGARDVRETTFVVRPAGLVALKFIDDCKPGSRWRWPLGFESTLCPQLGPEPTELTFEGVPPEGVPFKMGAFLEGKAGAGAAVVALAYPSNAPGLVVGPPTVTIPRNDWKEDFDLTVRPCPYTECVARIVATYRNRSLEFPVRVRR